MPFAVTFCTNEDRDGSQTFAFFVKISRVPFESRRPTPQCNSSEIMKLKQLIMNDLSIYTLLYFGNFDFCIAILERKLRNIIEILHKYERAIT